ncbi:hypothetical protein [Metabacillus fastidiosus]|uniref:hypothetical protein n=1 Tax=Metabacillus fastidiosus TaxID=1458 RepID=UPI003D2CE26E
MKIRILFGLIIKLIGIITIYGLIVTSDLTENCYFRRKGYVLMMIGIFISALTNSKTLTSKK